MSFTDALTRISDIQAQISALSSSATLAAVSSSLTAGTGASTASTASTASSASTDTGSGTNSTASAQFAAALAQAQATDGTSSDGTDSGLDDNALSASGTSDSALSASGLNDSALSDALLSSSLAGLTTSTPAASGGAAISSETGTLPAGATSMLTSDQRQFASTLVADTGLNPSVVSAWLLSEESGGAAQSRQSAGNNDWLNIGYTDSGTVGGGDSVWSDPVSAATATAQWLKGQDAIPGYGTASSGVQSILSSVGETPGSQITALQNSGWSSSGYPDLPSLYSEVSA